LPQTIARKLNQDIENLSVPAELVASFIDVDNSIIQALRNNFKSYITWPIPRSTRQKMIDSKLQQEDIKETVLRAQSGSTALVALIEDEFITLANVGDCRAGEINTFQTWYSLNLR
jgi:serine/threonine protein phosphatase PrpC